MKMITNQRQEKLPRPFGRYDLSYCFIMIMVMSLAQNDVQNGGFVTCSSQK
jgi:hypothetical protein